MKLLTVLIGIVASYAIFQASTSAQYCPTCVQQPAWSSPMTYSQPPMTYNQPPMTYNQPPMTYSQPQYVSATPSNTLPSPTATVMLGQSFQQAASACNCATTGSTGCGWCQNSPNCVYALTGSGKVWGPSTSNTTHDDLQWTPPSPTDCDEIVENISFYLDPPMDASGEIDLPRRYRQTVETYKFKRCSFDVCGCKVNVCVPCEIVCNECSECRKVPTTIPMKARIRTANSGGAKRADIWVYDIKGLPSKAVLALNVTAAEANTRFKTSEFAY